MKNKIILLFLFGLCLLASCENGDWEFNDYKYQTVYFAYQYPVRTITLGEDVYDTTLDNQHKCRIMATTGGVYDNNKNVTIDVEVDNSLCEGLLFNEGAGEIEAMPSGYYELASDQIVIPEGEITGGVEVQLTDAFFADSLSLDKNYVIPLVMTTVSGADSILSGVPLADNPKRTIAADWNELPKDYILYAIRYINPWDGYYLRRGEDVITGKNGNASLNQTIVRRAQYVEHDEVFKVTTRSLDKVEFPLVFKDSNGYNVECTLLLTFDQEGNCTVTAGSEGYTASGSGKFVRDGEKKSWGEKDRDALYLTYEIDLEEMHVSTTDTLVLRDRGVAMETFSPVLK
ncbi:DUF5627 domain-containing protein [Sinomicrobium kalidii]|uniref:DUF5627 domain-containing protein n=1 Tax=Sinomicrobium kalidii TaxID=2900738 RepID=UPI001E496740|nr:DUF5627 domain-containing protein [Sinomicrobium kalidii]UGU17696.1 DUF5627 domain-containing protein [Sinomicrobium kalidii]